MFEKFDEQPMTFKYTNFKGEISDRTILPMRTIYGKLSPSHNKSRWWLKGFDLDLKEVRYFDFNNMNKEV